MGEEGRVHWINSLLQTRDVRMLGIFSKRREYTEDLVELLILSLDALSPSPDTGYEFLEGFDFDFSNRLIESLEIPLSLIDSQISKCLIAPFGLGWLYPCQAIPYLIEAGCSFYTVAEGKRTTLLHESLYVKPLRLGKSLRFYLIAKGCPVNWRDELQQRTFIESAKAMRLKDELEFIKSRGLGD